MTFIAGFKKLNTVFLIADSAITIEGQNLPPLQSTESAFGQRHIDSSIKQIHSNGLKLIPLTDKVIAAYAGLVSLAERILIDLKSRLNTQPEGKSTEDIICDIMEEYETNNEPIIEVSFIFGVVESDETILFSYNDRLDEHPLIFRRLDGFVLSPDADDYSEELATFLRHPISYSGNTNDDFDEKFIKLFTSFLRNHNDLSDDDFLTGFCSVLQSLTIHYHYDLECGYGGTYSGIRINQSGTKWMPHILYFIYSNQAKNLNGLDIRLIQVFNHSDNSIFKFYTHGDPVRHSYELIRNGFMANEYNFIVNDALLSSYLYIAFININENYVLLLDKDKTEEAKKTGHFVVRYEKEGYYLNIGPKLSEYILRPNKLQGNNTGFEIL